MKLFHLVFTLFMLLLPAAISLFVRPRAGSAIDRRAVRRRRGQLWFGTGIALALVVIVRLAEGAGWLDFWGRLPRLFTWSEQPSQLLWMLFFPLWFGLFLRLLQTVRPEATTAYAAPRKGPVQRTASLTSRRRESSVRARHWALIWAAWGVAVIAVTLRVWSNGLPAAVEGNLPMMLILMLGLAPLPLVIGPWALRMLLVEPEPLDDGGSVELRNAYTRHRETKAWGLYWLNVAMVLLFSSMPIAVVWAPQSGPALGAVGAIGGSFIGVGGAIFGMRMGLQRMKIKEHLEELIRGQGPVSEA